MFSENPSTLLSFGHRPDVCTNFQRNIREKNCLGTNWLNAAKWPKDTYLFVEHAIPCKFAKTKGFCGPITTVKWSNPFIQHTACMYTVNGGRARGIGYVQGIEEGRAASKSPHFLSTSQQDVFADIIQNSAV
jgi:hypothetical protein